MRLLQKAVAVFYTLGAGVSLVTNCPAKKNERNIPATIFDVSRQQETKRLKKIAPE